LLDLLQAIVTAIPDGPLIIASGGVSTGSQIAALLTIGASAVVLGTRYLFTHECSYPQPMKEMILEAGLNSTARSLVFDEVHPTPFAATWPEGIDGRCIINNVWKEAQMGLSLEERRKRAGEGKGRGDKDYLLVWSGVGVGLVNEIVGAAVRVSSATIVRILNVLGPTGTDSHTA
jgi:nitronate monooxygenase